MTSVDLVPVSSLHHRRLVGVVAKCLFEVDNPTNFSHNFDDNGLLPLKVVENNHFILICGDCDEGTNNASLSSAAITLRKPKVPTSSAT